LHFAESLLDKNSKIQSLELSTVCKYPKEVFPKDVIDFRSFLDKKQNNKTELLQSLQFLARCLYEQYEKKVLILVDEFDKPVNNFLMIQKNFFTKREEAINIAALISDLVGANSKDNTHVKQIIITGILNSEIREQSSQMNNFRQFGLTSDQMTNCFGFISEEIYWLLDQTFNFNNSPNLKQHLFDKLKEMYNGVVNINKQELFTPYSVITCLSDLISRIKNTNNISDFTCISFWTQTETTSILKNFAEFALDHQPLQSIFDKLLDISIEKEVEFPCKIGEPLHAILSSDLKDRSVFERLVFHYLFNSGYITMSQKQPRKYRIPAKEVQDEFIENIQNLWISNYFEEDAWNSVMMEAKKLEFSMDDLSQLEECLVKSVNMTKKHQFKMNESVFEKILYFIFAHSKKNANNYWFGTQIHSGTGFLDVLSANLKKFDLYELKFLEDGTGAKTEEILKEAFNQIREKCYIAVIADYIEEKKFKNITMIRLIPMVLFKVRSEGEYLCKIGKIEEIDIETVKKLVEEWRENKPKKENKLKKRNYKQVNEEMKDEGIEKRMK